MSVVENSHGNPTEKSPSEKNLWTCPSCGATSEAGVGPLAQDGSTGSVVCGSCGAKFPDPTAHAQFENAPGSPALQPPLRQSTRNPLALVVVAVIAAGMLYFGFHMARRSGADHEPGIGYGTPAPDFTLETLDGKNLSLSDLHGKAVVVNFWATWCGPCKIETPWLVELQNEYGAQGLQVVGVAMDDSGKDEIAKFAKDMGVNYPVLIGKEAVGDAYGGVPALPESFFVGRDGKIVDRIIGLKGRSEIEDSVKKALKTQVSASTMTSAPARLQAQN